MKITVVSFLCASIFAACLLVGSAEGIEPSVDFIRDVRPILSEHCFPCHGPNDESRKAGLRLVDFESATTQLKSGLIAIVPGSRDDSELWLRITDPDDPMPPAKEHNELSFRAGRNPRTVDRGGCSLRAALGLCLPAAGRCSGDRS